MGKVSASVSVGVSVSVFVCVSVCMCVRVCVCAYVYVSTSEAQCLPGSYSCVYFLLQSSGAICTIVYTIILHYGTNCCARLYFGWVHGMCKVYTLVLCALQRGVCVCGGNGGGGRIKGEGG